MVTVVSAVTKPAARKRENGNARKIALIHGMLTPHCRLPVRPDRFITPRITPLDTYVYVCPSADLFFRASFDAFYN